MPGYPYSSDWGGARTGAGRCPSEDRCPCGAMTRERAAKRRHRCAQMGSSSAPKVQLTAAEWKRIDRMMGRETPQDTPRAVGDGRRRPTARRAAETKAARENERFELWHARKGSKSPAARPIG